ncbi:Protein LST4 [Dirofilaria immitis]
MQWKLPEIDNCNALIIYPKEVMSIYIIIIIPFLSFTFSLIHRSSNYTIETFPDSLARPDLCGINSPGFACDPDQLLQRFNHTFSGAEYLSQHLQRIRYATNCSCLEEDRLYGHCSIINPHGYTISIAVMKSIAINNDTMNSKRLIDSLRIFAENLRQRQNRGQCADDALIVAIANWNFVYTSVGEVIGKVLTPSVIARISQEAEPLLSSANYLYGLTFMVDGYGQFLQYSAPDTENKSWKMIWSSIMSNWLNIFLSLIVLISFVILIVLIVMRFCCNEKQKYIVGRQVTH